MTQNCLKRQFDDDFYEKKACSSPKILIHKYDLHHRVEKIGEIQRTPGKNANLANVLTYKIIDAINSSPKWHLFYCFSFV